MLPMPLPRSQYSRILSVGRIRDELIRPYLVMDAAELGHTD
jgi:hypothetical protein